MMGFRVWRILRVVTFVLVTAMLCPPAAGKVIYVDDDAAGANDGTSWANAYVYLQEALADAAFAQKPVEIRVAQGTYRPNQGLVAIPEFDWRTTTFQLINGVTVKGGYAGPAEPDPDARDIELYETTLNGDLNGDDDPNFANNSENSYHVVTGSETDETAVLDGFTITAGNANGPLLGESPNFDSRLWYGAGMYNVSGSPSLTNCIFKGNSANARGGGMYNYNSSPILTNCTFSDNTASDFAGGMYISSYDYVSSPKLSNCTFVGNSADYGNALACDSYDEEHPSSLELSNSILWDNGNEIWNGDNSEIVVAYSDVQGGWPGEGNIDADPLFADTDNGDYHLKSQAGRWDPVSEDWVIDDVTSPCIDAGDPGSPVGAEPFPNGLIIDMGAYGGTVEASKSPSGLHSKYGGGTGEPTDPWLIYTAEQMNTIGLYTEDWDKHFRLMADIDLAAFRGTDFNIIGRYRHQEEYTPFSGTFDGNGRTISNFTYSTPDVNDIAMFAFISGSNAAITDLGLIDPNVNAGTGDSVASLVGNMSGGSISGCYVRGGRILGNDWVGGLVAYNSGTITDCYSSAEATGLADAGGLAGYNAGTIIGCRSFSSVSGRKSVGGLAGNNDGTILDSYSAGQVVGDKVVGGLVGWSWGLVRNCGSEGNVIGIIDDIGGLVGRSYGEIIGCYATGAVSGFDVVGGLVGRSQGSIARSYSASEVIGTEADSNTIGGLVGDSRGSITTCYSAGSVSADAIVGGLVGISRETIMNSYSTARVIGGS
ncbi:MAG: GLUG motif-containing protein, partial [Planctomycetota bacterium]